MKFSQLTLALLVLVMSCKNSDDQSEKNDGPMKDTTTTLSGETSEISLFDGKTFAGWHAFNKTGKIENWMIEDGAMVCLGAAPDAEGGDIVSDREFENFDLSWEWKMSKAGNSGLMYHVVESSQYRAPYETGPEYQMIDDVDFPGKLEDWQKSGADYAMYAPNEKKNLKAVGEWNSSRILFNKGKVEHWLNGEKIIEFTAWDKDWTTKKETGKWKDYPGYGTAKKGRIALQDHGQKVYFRNIRIREF